MGIRRPISLYSTKNGCMQQMKIGITVGDINGIGLEVRYEASLVLALGDKCFDVFLMCGHSVWIVRNYAFIDASIT